MWLWVNAYGEFGTGRGNKEFGGPYSKDQEALGINWWPNFEFPAGSRIDYLYDAGLAVGCVRGFDTLVTTTVIPTRYFFGRAGDEFTPYDTIWEATTKRASQYYDPNATAEQQYFAVYADTAIDEELQGFYLDERDLRPHIPIGLEVRQTSYSWSGGASNRFVIVDFNIKNISGGVIEDGCVGFVVRPLIFYDYVNNYGVRNVDDDVCGFLPVVPGLVEGAVETMNLVWTADNDGDPVWGEFPPRSARGAFGIRILRAPPRAPFSFNWFGSVWVGGGLWFFGPHLAKNAQGPDWWKSGWGWGDVGRYRVMTNGEIDYDQVHAALDFSAQGWERPPSDLLDFGPEIADGAFVQFVVSYGPLPDLAPGDSIPFTIAFVAGGDFHTNPRNFADNFSVYKPKPYLDQLNFGDLIDNARAADWVFDTPGIDTDRDGYAGKFYLVDCGRPQGCDTLWYKGDGVPDWRAPSSPLALSFELETRPHTVALRWTGASTETAKAVMSRRRDFEGYRVYSSRFNIADQYSLLASWDRVDFTRWAHQPLTNDWRQISHPLTTDEWRRELGDPEFDPEQYVHPSFATGYRDSVSDTVRNVQGEIVSITGRDRFSYWAKEGANQENQYWQDDTWETNPIQRVSERDTVVDGDTLTYGIYEFSLDNLNPSIPLYFAVTAFDQYDYQRKVGPLESSPSANAQYAVPVHSADVVADSGLKVSVYPNPYKSQFRDAFGNWTNYYGQGYEAAGKPQLTEHDRRIYFINLPEEATIRIFSLDGDLIREIHHPDPFLTTYSSIVGWDLISRNTQLVESGLYLWRVDSKLGSQVGKLVIIR